MHHLPLGQAKGTSIEAVLLSGASSAVTVTGGRPAATVTSLMVVASAVESTAAAADSMVERSTSLPAPSLVAIVMVSSRPPLCSARERRRAAVASSVMSDGFTPYCKASLWMSASRCAAKSSMDRSSVIVCVTVATSCVSVDWPTGMITGLAPPWMSSRNAPGQ